MSSFSTAQSRTRRGTKIDCVLFGCPCFASAALFRAFLGLLRLIILLHHRVLLRSMQDVFVSFFWMFLYSTICLVRRTIKFVRCWVCFRKCQCGIITALIIFLIPVDIKITFVINHISHNYMVCHIPQCFYIYLKFLIQQQLIY